MPSKPPTKVEVNLHCVIRNADQTALKEKIGNGKAAGYAIAFGAYGFLVLGSAKKRVTPEVILSVRNAVGAVFPGIKVETKSLAD